MDNQSSSKLLYPIPDNYKFVKVLGEGGFGTVIKCIKQDTNEEVAVKIKKEQKNSNLEEEASIMRHLMKHNLDKFNIVKYNGELMVDGVLSLEYESLDICLFEYMIDLEEWMPLEEIRSIIQQMGVALNALKSINMIHADLKLNNILLVNHVKQPLRVKLIDFGLALSSKDAQQGMTLQVPDFRAPEIILGLPFSESIDIWALGVIMATMMFHTVLFPGEDEYQTLQCISDLLGPPPDRLLNAGCKSQIFFKKTTSGLWTLKTPEEYYSCNKDWEDERQYAVCSLDEVKLEESRKCAEWTECIELLKAMLQWDEKDRISPSGILNHPFITKSDLRPLHSDCSCTKDEDGTRKDQELEKMDEEMKKKDEKIKRMIKEMKRKEEEIKRMLEEIKEKDEVIKEIKKNKKKDSIWSWIKRNVPDAAV